MNDGKRLEDLESQLAYLERGNQELGDVVYRQQQALDALAARVERLAEQLRAAMEQGSDHPAADERPPHY